MPGLTHEAIDDIFTYHAPTPEQLPKYQALRDKAKELGHLILDTVPPGPDQTASVRLLRESIMTANACIALQGKY